MRRLLPLAALLLTAGAPPARDAALLREAMLAGHNAARAAAGVPPLGWDAALVDSARAYALTLARTGTFRHDPALAASDEQGENLWSGERDHHAYAEMMAGWLAERQLFVNRAFPDVSTSGRWEDVAHYTQIMWRTTRRVGCATAADVSREYLVCRYATPGNWEGETAY